MGFILIVIPFTALSQISHDARCVDVYVFFIAEDENACKAASQGWAFLESIMRFPKPRGDL